MSASPTMFTPRWLTNWLDVPCDNPGFAISLSQAEAEFSRMAAHPARLERPVVVLAGYRAWAFMPRNVAGDLQRLTGAQPGQFLPISYPWRTDIPRLAGEVCRAVERQWPSPDPERTVEVDVVGISMGGLVGRAAAGKRTRKGESKRLRIARLFTLATPHRGAKLAEVAQPDAGARDMLPGSEFLRLLDQELAEAEYELVCYSRLRDSWVGATRAAPQGHQVHWVSGLRVGAHITMTQERRVIVDIARRLRGEPSFAGSPCPPPRD